MSTDSFDVPTDYLEDVRRAAVAAARPIIEANVLDRVRSVPGQKWESDGHWLLAEDVFRAIEGGEQT